MESSRKVTFFIGHLLQGGAERVVANLSSIMAEKGLDVMIISYYGDDSVYELNEKVKLVKVQSETGSLNIAKNLLFIRKIFKKRRGTIYSFIAIFNILAVLAKLGLSIKLIVADRNDPDRIPRQSYMRCIRDIAYRFADAVIVQTERNAEYFKRKITTDVQVIYNPLELGDKEGMALVASKEDTIVSVGRLVAQKNQKMLVRAFAGVHKLFPTYRLVIYGEGDYRLELEAYIKELGLEHHVSLPGNFSDIYDRIAKARLFVLTSDFEGMPNALIEAMGLGLPVISTRVSGATDLIIDRVNGELISVGAVEELQERIISVLSDYKLQEKYGNAAKNVCKILDAEVIAKEWLDLYE